MNADKRCLVGRIYVMDGITRSPLISGAFSISRLELAPDIMFDCWKR